MIPEVWHCLPVFKGGTSHLLQQLSGAMAAICAFYRLSVDISAAALNELASVSIPPPPTTPHDTRRQKLHRWRRPRGASPTSAAANLDRWAVLRTK